MLFVLPVGGNKLCEIQTTARLQKALLMDAEIMAKAGNENKTKKKPSRSSKHNIDHGRGPTAICYASSPFIIIIIISIIIVIEMPDLFPGKVLILIQPCPPSGWADLVSRRACELWKAVDSTKTIVLFR